MYRLKELGIPYETEQETKYPLPEVMTASHRIKIYDEKGNLVKTLIFWMTNDHEDRYVELLDKEELRNSLYEDVMYIKKL